MKRRNFLGSAAAAGITAVSADESASSPDNRQSPVLHLSGEYYRHYPVDFDLGGRGALGFGGWGESIEIEAPLQETALVPMHIWNVGLSDELPFSPRGPAGGVMKMLEWAARSKEIIRTEIPPIFDAARSAGMKVIHVASDENYAKNYPGFALTKAAAGQEPPGLAKAPRHNETKVPDSAKSSLIFGPEFERDIGYYSPRIDFPEEAKPLDSEHVVLTTHQFNEVLRKYGIWNLIYVGFAINWCLWFSPCGMLDMSRLGYRCSCIREAVTAVENRESTVGEMNKQQALWRTSLMFGYIHSAKNFIKACNSM